VEHRCGADSRPSHHRPCQDDRRDRKEDELGYVPATKVGAELLFDVISTAYERTGMIETTKLTFESWTEVLGSERLTGATLDWLIHRCKIIETKGESYRLHDAKTRGRRNKAGPAVDDAQADR